MLERARYNAAFNVVFNASFNVAIFHRKSNAKSKVSNTPLASSDNAPKLCSRALDVCSRLWPSAFASTHQTTLAPMNEKLILMVKLTDPSVKAQGKLMVKLQSTRLTLKLMVKLNDPSIHIAQHGPLHILLSLTTTGTNIFRLPAQTLRLFRLRV